MALDPKAAPTGAAAVDWRARAERFELALRTIARSKNYHEARMAEVRAILHERLPFEAEGQHAS